VGSAITTLQINGTGYISSSTVTFNGASHKATMVSSSQLTIQLSTSDLGVIGDFVVGVTNPSPGGGTVSTSGKTNFAVLGPVLAGTVFKGPVNGATVTAYAVGTDGSSGATLGSGVTDSSGNFTMNLTAIPSGSVRVTATGGTYVSEEDGSTVTSTSSISGLLDSVPIAGMSGISITAASDFVNSLTVGAVKGLTPALRLRRAARRTVRSAATPSSLTSAHANSNAALSAFYGLSTGLTLETLIPKFDKSDINSDAFKFGLVIGTLTQEGKLDAATSPDDIVAALSADISDGLFDGKVAGTPVTIGKSATPLPFTAGTTDFLNDLSTYISTGIAVTSAGIVPSDVSTDTAAISTGISLSPYTPAAVGLTAGSSGAIGTASFGGSQYLFVAGRQKGVIVVDITDPTKTAPLVKSWPQIAANNFSGNSIGGVVPIPSTVSGHPQVLCYAYESKHWALLNAQTLVSGTPGTDNPVDTEGDLPLLATSPVNFSGGSAYIAGSLPSGTTGIYLATADGYYFFDLSTNTLGTLYPIDPSQMLAENVGGDIAHGILLAGNYNGVQLVDLSKKASYYMDLPTMTSTFGIYSADADSVDSHLRVGIMTEEDGPNVGLLNMATITENDSTTPKSFTTTTAGVAQILLGSSGPIISGSAVDGTTDLALFMAGYSDDIAVGQLQDPASVSSGSQWLGLTDWRFYTLTNSPSLSGYQYATDPHAVGVVFNLKTGKAYGYLLDGSVLPTGVVQVDMAGFVTLPAAGTTGDAAHQPAGDPVTAGVLSEIAVP